MIFKLEINYRPAGLVFPYSCAFVADGGKVHLKRNDTTTSFKMADWKILLSASPAKNSIMTEKNVYK